MKKLAIVAALVLSLMPAPARADSTVCTRVIGLSQVREWYNRGFETYVPNANWELFWHGQGRVDMWIDPNSLMWRYGKLVSPCTAGPVDRIIFNVAPEMWQDTQEEVPVLIQHLQAVIATIHGKFPGLPIVLQPITGGPNGGLCYFNGVLVNASVIHPYAEQAIAAVVGPGVTAGPDLHVGSCSWFRDTTGHLNAPDARRLATVIGTYWAS